MGATWAMFGSFHGSLTWQKHAWPRLTQAKCTPSPRVMKQLTPAGVAVIENNHCASFVASHSFTIREGTVSLATASSRKHETLVDTNQAALGQCVAKRKQRGGAEAGLCTGWTFQNVARASPNLRASLRKARPSKS